MDALDVHPRILEALKRAKLRDHVTILSMSSPDLVRSTRLSAADIGILHKAIAISVQSCCMVTGLQLLEGSVPENLHTRRLTTGCPVIDDFLKGGVLSRGITEISGESASGKTQVCLQLCLTVQIPIHKGGLGGGAVYICTEDVFPNKRLMQMLHHFRHTNAAQELPSQFGDNIFIEHASDLDDLWLCVSRRIPLLLSRGAVKLIIIDSIAALFRCEYSVKETVQRAKQLGSFAAQLHRLNNQYNIPVICVNQVSAKMDESRHGEKQVIPALGISWANLITTRLMLSRTNYTMNATQRDSSGLNACQTSTIVRTLEVMLAPHLPPSKMHFYVDQSGVKGIT